MTDEYLMQCVKNGDLDKAAILYERYKKKLYHFFLHKNNLDKERSEDGVQQVFYRMIKYRSSYRDGNSFSIWIYGIAKNIQYQDYRDQLKMTTIQNDHPEAEVYDPVNDDHSAL